MSNGLKSQNIFLEFISSYHLKASENYDDEYLQMLANKIANDNKWDNPILIE